MTILERIQAKCIADPQTGCWLWTGSKDSGGYARIHYEGRNCRASRVSWSASRGEVWPQGKHALHSCDNKACVNPQHIRPGTHSENIKEAWDRGALKKRRQRFKTHCNSGHALTPDNLVSYKSAAGSMFCRTCALESAARSNAKRRARRDA